MVYEKGTINTRAVHQYVDALVKRYHDVELIAKSLAASIDSSVLSLNPAERDRIVYKRFARYLERLTMEDFQEVSREIEEGARFFVRLRESRIGTSEDRPTLCGASYRHITEKGYLQSGKRIVASCKRLKRKLSQVRDDSVERVGADLIRRFLDSNIKI